MKRITFNSTAQRPDIMSEGIYAREEKEDKHHSPNLVASTRIQGDWMRHSEVVFFATTSPILNDNIADVLSISVATHD